MKLKRYLFCHLLFYLQEIWLAICLKFNLGACGCKISHSACGVKSSQISAEQPVRISDPKVCFQVTSSKRFCLFFQDIFPPPKSLLKIDTTFYGNTSIERQEACQCWETLTRANFRSVWLLRVVRGIQTEKKNKKKTSHTQFHPRLNLFDFVVDNMKTR